MSALLFVFDPNFFPSLQLSSSTPALFFNPKYAYGGLFKLIFRLKNQKKRSMSSFGDSSN